MTLDYAQEFLPNHLLSRIFERLEIKCVLDVGANAGQYHEFLRDKVGFDGSIIWFEPVPRHVEILNAKAKRDQRWTVYDFALGEEDGELEIKIMEGGELSSFLPPEQTSPAMTIKSPVRIPVRTIDSVAHLIEKVCP